MKLKQSLLAAVHEMRQKGELSALPAADVRQILEEFKAAGCLTNDVVPRDLIFKGCTPGVVAHIIHAMNQSGELSKVSREHVDAIVYALQCSGFKDVISTQTANYVRPGLISWHSIEFMQDEQFAQAYRAGVETNSWQGLDCEWRIHVALWAAKQALNIEGDFVECGVNRGGIALAIIKYLNLKTTFWLLDTFYGIPDEFKDVAAKSSFFYEECFEEAKETFAAYENVRMVKGVIPDTLTQVTSEKIAFLSIDLNCAEPEIAAGEHFWSRLSTGGIIVLDDYGANEYKRQKEAWDQFAVRHAVSVLSLPTGQGMIVKP